MRQPAATRMHSVAMRSLKNRTSMVSCLEQGKSAVISIQTSQPQLQRWRLDLLFKILPWLKSLLHCRQRLLGNLGSEYCCLSPHFHSFDSKGGTIWRCSQVKKIHQREFLAGKLVLEEFCLHSGIKTGLPLRPICRLKFLFSHKKSCFFTQIVRTDILGTLSAGRAEGGGAYTRGYTNVTRCPLSPLQ